jgi:hypothetical protein
MIIQSAYMPILRYTLIGSVSNYSRQLSSTLTSTISRAHNASISCYHPFSTWVTSITYILCIATFSCSPLLTALLLLMAGDVEVNPGPMEGPTIAFATPSTSADLPSSGPITREHLHILNRNCRCIDGKLSGLPQFLQTHDIHVANLTETRRSIGTHKSSQDFQSGGYTFYFSSHVDASHSTPFISSRARKWGVCIAVRTGLAYQSVESHLAQFDAGFNMALLGVPPHRVI